MLEHKLWLSYAENELKTAELALKNDTIFSSAFFLTQQCAEKALKAYLVYHKRKMRKIHDLLEIAKECSAVDESFQAIYYECKELNPYISTYRYPEVGLPFSDKTTLEISIKEAQKILEFVKSRLG